MADKGKKVGIAALAGIGGVAGYLWAGLLTAAEIVTVSSPVGIVCGAVAFVGLALSSDKESEDD